VLRPLSSLFNSADYPDLLIGLGKADDAAVYRLSDDQALVATVDFFTPIVDDPYAYGAIAAANSLSDVYAMGGRPIFALNIAAFPADLPEDVMAAILRGGAEKVREAGAAIAGGHTIQDKEPKYGLVVLGLVDPRRVLTKAGARPGDVLVLTKSLGAGVITTALKRDLATAEQVAVATASMLRLNRAASEAALAAGVWSATDVTGFGLLGHASEMLELEGNGVGFRFYFDRLPWLPGAQELGDAWVYPGGAHNNRQHYGRWVRFDKRLSEAQQTLCFSPETSGGLLMAVPAGEVEGMLSRLEQAWVVGEVVEMGEAGIEVV
jgi:selenide, water dikinase